MGHLLKDLSDAFMKFFLPLLWFVCSNHLSTLIISEDFLPIFINITDTVVSVHFLKKLNYISNLRMYNRFKFKMHYHVISSLCGQIFLLQKRIFHTISSDHGFTTSISSPAPHLPNIMPFFSLIKTQNQKP